MLTFRGTELEPRDWSTDLNALPTAWPAGGQVHRGFADALRDVWDEVAAALVGLPSRLLYTGHSLGAALATLAASLRQPTVRYTFGSPRVGDAAFVQSLAALPHHRFVNCCDVVCRVPPEALGYAHLGPPAYLDGYGHLHVAPDDELVEKDQARARRAYLWRYAWRLGTLWTRDVADHTPANYVAAAAQLPGGAP
ncbi:MAG TPA: lipase family protein [Gemmatimonadales bacterium]